MGADKRRITGTRTTWHIVTFSSLIHSFSSILISVFGTPAPQKHPHGLSLLVPTVAVFSRLTAPPRVSHPRHFWTYTGPYKSSLRPSLRSLRHSRPSPHFHSPFLDLCGRTWQQRHDKFKPCSLCCSVMLYSPSISSLFNLQYGSYFLSVMAVWCLLSPEAVIVQKWQKAGIMTGAFWLCPSLNKTLIYHSNITFISWLLPSLSTNRRRTPGSEESPCQPCQQDSTFKTSSYRLFSTVFVFTDIMFSVTGSSSLLHKQTCPCTPGRDIIGSLCRVFFTDCRWNFLLHCPWKWISPNRYW